MLKGADDSNNNFSYLSFTSILLFIQVILHSNYSCQMSTEKAHATLPNLPCCRNGPFLPITCLSFLSETSLNWKTAHFPPTQAVIVKIHLDFLSGKTS